MPAAARAEKTPSSSLPLLLSCRLRMRLRCLQRAHRHPTACPRLSARVEGMPSTHRIRLPWENEPPFGGSHLLLRSSYRSGPRGIERRLSVDFQGPLWNRSAASPPLWPPAPVVQRRRMPERHVVILLAVRPGVRRGVRAFHAVEADGVSYFPLLSLRVGDGCRGKSHHRKKTRETETRR